MEKLVLWALTTLVSAFIGSYLAGYLRKKGENLATHEDIHILVEQVRTVTTTTKEIEAKISGDVWDRQKRWELKRDVLFEATRKVAQLDDALVDLTSALPTEKIHEQLLKEAFREKAKQLIAALGAFDETKLLVGMVCSPETKSEFVALGVLAEKIADRLSKEDAEIYDKSRAELANRLAALRVAIRKELEIDKPA